MEYRPSELVQPRDAGSPRVVQNPGRGNQEIDGGCLAVPVLQDPPAAVEPRADDLGGESDSLRQPTSFRHVDEVGLDLGAG
jgi:hypothetical protein